MSNEHEPEEREIFFETPWGCYEIILEGGKLGEMYRVKRLTVRPGARMSLQSHQARGENITVVSGKGIVEIGRPAQDGNVQFDVVMLQPGMTVSIGVGQPHRVGCYGPQALVCIETQMGKRAPEESDITRYEDDYGRPTARGR